MIIKSFGLALIPLLMMIGCIVGSSSTLCSFEAIVYLIPSVSIHSLSLVHIKLIIKTTLPSFLLYCKNNSNFKIIQILFKKEKLIIIFII